MCRMVTILLMLSIMLVPQARQASTTPPLKDVKEIQVMSTVVNNPEKVKNPDAASLVEKGLRRAVLANELHVVESAPVKIRISLDEFTGGSFATRFVVGFGAGRSTVDCRIQLLDQNEKEITSARVRARGSLAWGAYQGNTAQTKDAVNKFDQTLTDQIEKWK
jgi:hypothetical protein